MNVLNYVKMQSFQSYGNLPSLLKRELKHIYLDDVRCDAVSLRLGDLLIFSPQPEGFGGL